MRTLRPALQEALKFEVGVHHPGFAWLVEHAADILNKCAVGRDGRTPYERIKKKKKYGGEMFEFGSIVHVKLQGKLQGGLMRERWVRGVWLGKRWSCCNSSRRGWPITWWSIRPN